MLYKILYVKTSEAMDRGGLVFPSQLHAEDYIKKASQESPDFHYWAEPMPEPKITEQETQVTIRALKKIQANLGR